ncbi:MAG: hypothetical protein HS104_34830 [Polyangiaceae bacterium]|nr:hypothetical protein [Polyangiaceae bacterium]MCE7893324.1 hypothetical protein [Sorangiineae bacterium PRO1]MCL4752450.1 hypothetical protein [Myxococcales bacterium]
MTPGLLLPLTLVVADLTGAPIPEASQASAEARSEPEWRAVRAGGVLFGGSYAVCVGGAVAQSFGEDSGRLAIPLAGPWLTLDSGNPWALVMAGTAQLAGVTFAVWGFASPRRVLGPAEATVSVAAAADGVRAPAVRLDVRF